MEAIFSFGAPWFLIIHLSAHVANAFTSSNSVLAIFAYITVRASAHDSLLDKARTAGPVARGLIVEHPAVGRADVKRGFRPVNNSAGIFVLCRNSCCEHNHQPKDSC